MMEIQRTFDTQQIWKQSYCTVTGDHEGIRDRQRLASILKLLIKVTESFLG